MARRRKILKDGYSSFTGYSYRGELARLGGLAHLGEMIFIPRSHGIFYLSSIKKFRLCIKPGIQERGTKCRKRGEWKECYISRNVGKQSGECPSKLLGMSSNIPGNIAKNSGECPQLFRGMSSNIPGNVAEHSGECPVNFDGRELVGASSITVVFLVALLIVCSVIFCVKL